MRAGHFPPPIPMTPLPDWSVAVAHLTAGLLAQRGQLERLQKRVEALEAAVRSVTRVPRAEPAERRCWRCQTFRPIDAFGRRGGGHDYICRACQRERSRERKAAA